MTRAKQRIAILGAGPGGTGMALELVRSGVDPADLVLIDKARFPRPKLCGGGKAGSGGAPQKPHGGGHDVGEALGGGEAG